MFEDIRTAGGGDCLLVTIIIQKAGSFSYLRGAPPPNDIKFGAKSGWTESAGLDIEGQANKRGGSWQDWTLED